MYRIIIMYEIKRKMKLTKLQHSDAMKKIMLSLCNTTANCDQTFKI